MTATQNGTDFDGISVHNFSEKILEQVVHFHVMKLSGGFFLWVGSSPVLSNLAVSMSSKYVSQTPSVQKKCLFISPVNLSFLFRLCCKMTSRVSNVAYSLK